MRRQIRKRRSVRRAGPTVTADPKLLWIGGAVLLAVLILLYMILFTGIFRKDNEMTKLDITETAEISTADGSTIYYLEGSTLHAINTSGKTLWTSKYSSGKMHLQAGEQIICLYNDTTATVLDNNKNPLFNIPGSDFTIEQVTCGRNTVAIQCSLPENKATYLRIFDNAGVELDRIEIATASLLDFGFFGESDNLWYLTLDTSGAEPICRIMTSMPAQQKLTGLYEVYGQLVSNVKFLGSNVYVNTTSSFIAYDTFGEIFFEKMIYGSRPADDLISGEDLIMAYIPSTDTSGNSSTLRLLSTGGLDTLVLLPSGIEHVALSEKNVYCFAKDVIYLYDYSGNFVKNIELDFEITDFAKLHDGLVLLHTEDAAHLFTLN
ncbi:MAG: hypothetical protein IKM60_00110 [Clostridia bacterium]|nr:hypothetical protein [Clostridia bacterium]